MEKATFDAAKTLSDARNATTHHFQEGNLPNNSKCVKCKKGCWSPDCLTGMRCQWCGMSAHSSCVPNIPGALAVCQFGLLEPIFLPPAAISTPRIQYTSEKTVVTKSHALMQARKYFPLSNQISFWNWIDTLKLDNASKWIKTKYRSFSTLICRFFRFVFSRNNTGLDLYYQNQKTIFHATFSNFYT